MRHDSGTVDIGLDLDPLLLIRTSYLIDFQCVLTVHASFYSHSSIVLEEPDPPQVAVITACKL